MSENKIEKIYQDIEMEDINQLNLLKIPHPLPTGVSPQDPWAYYQACFDQIFRQCDRAPR